MEERTQHRTSAPGRLRFVLGSMATDVALPAEVPLVDLLPAVLPQFGAEWIEQGADHEGWVVQRLGEPPLDEDRTPVELNLLDGETLYLRPRADQFSPIDYDDLVDGIAEQIREDPGAWSPKRTRWALLLGAASALLAMMLVLLAGGPDLVRAILAAAMAVALLIGAAVTARATSQVTAASILVGVAACFAAGAGWLLAFAIDPLATPVLGLTCAATETLAVLVLGLAAVADAALPFTGAITAVLMLLITCVIGVLAPVDLQQSASIGLMITMIAGMFVPATAFRLSGLTLPMLPTNPEELREDIEPVPHRVIVERGAVAVGYSKALHLGFGAAQAPLLVVLALGGGLFPMILVAVYALLLFLRSRHLDGAVQRWAMLVPAACAVLADVYALTGTMDFLTRLEILCLPLLVVGVTLVVLSGHLPGRRLRPYWGRAVEILELLTAVSALPLLLAVLNVYEWIRGLSG